MWSDTGDELYFAESWALVHYMLNSPEYSPTFSQRATEYSRNIATGMDPVTTFKSVFGVGANTLNQDVWEYIINSQPAGVSIPLESALPAFQADVSQMSHQEITQALREYRLAQGKETIEHSEISDAVEHSPANAHRQLDMANSLYQQALAAQPSEREALITLAKSHYLKAQELDATQVEFYAMYGQTLLLEGRNTDLAVVMLKEARRLLPSSTVILRALAQGYRATDQKDEAVNLDHLAEKYESESAVAKHTHRILEF